MEKHRAQLSSVRPALRRVSGAHAMLPHGIWLGICFPTPHVLGVMTPLAGARALTYDRENGGQSQARTGDLRLMKALL